MLRMRCPYCQAQDTQVLDTRKLDAGGKIRRRRRCEVCDRRFTTLERIESLPLMVIKKSGVREPFEREKLDRKSTRLNSSHANISYAVFCLKKKKNISDIRLKD